jgi:hypothetical protein
MIISSVHTDQSMTTNFHEPLAEMWLPKNPAILSHDRVQCLDEALRR